MAPSGLNSGTTAERARGGDWMGDLRASIRGGFQELRRRRVFRVAGAYAVVGWLLLQVADATFAPLGLPPWSQRALIIAVAAGFVVACALAWVYDLTAQGVVRTPAQAPEQDAAPAVAPAPAPAAAAAGGRPSASPHVASVAILPFVDLSQAKDQDWFCDGLAEEIIDALCCVRGLRVASRTASFRYRDGSVDPREIGRELGVEAILEGSVRKAGEQVRVTAQLINARDGYHLWSESFDRKLEDIFAIQSEIARNVAQALRLSLTSAAAGRIERYAPRNLEAYEFYLRGRQLAGQFIVVSWRQAAQMFRRAMQLDPDYAQAHAGLADALAQLVLWRHVEAAAVVPEASAAARRAIELAPDLAEAHVALGHILSLSGEPEAATLEFERAIELNPELHEAYNYFGRHCFAHGDYARAANLLEAAFRARPDEYSVLVLAAAAMDASGDRARAAETGRIALAGLTRQTELEPDNARAHYMAALAHARLGDAAAGLPLVETALRVRPDDFATMYNSACYFSLAGDRERALALLDQAMRTGAGNPDWIEFDTDLAPLRPDPRFRAIVARTQPSPPAAPG